MFGFISTFLNKRRSSKNRYNQLIDDVHTGITYIKMCKTLDPTLPFETRLASKIRFAEALGMLDLAVKHRAIHVDLTTTLSQIKNSISEINERRTTRTTTLSSFSVTKRNNEYMYLKRNLNMKNVFARAWNYVCVYCNQEVLHDDFHIDHIKARNKGGSNDLDNLTLSCARCNIRKHDRYLPENLRHILLQRATEVAKQLRS